MIDFISLIIYPLDQFHLLEMLFAYYVGWTVLAVFGLVIAKLN